MKIAETLKTLTYLNLSTNRVSDATLKTIDEYLTRNKIIVEQKAEALNVEGNDLYNQ